MKILDLSCNNCGAPLEAPMKANFVTCTFCGVRLKVQHEGNAAWTEEVEKIHGELRALRKEQAVARIDREWEVERRKHLVRSKHGVSVPSRAGGIAGMVISAIAGLFFMLFTANLSGGSGMMPLFGVLMVIVGAGTGYYQVRKAEQLERARRRYQTRRRKALDDLAQGK